MHLLSLGLELLHWAICYIYDLTKPHAVLEGDTFS